MAQVTIDGERYEAQVGERLSDVLIRINKTIPMPCGGRGDCGKCRVTVNGTTALACEYVVGSDITVKLPPREIIAGETVTAASGRQTAHGAFVLDVGTTTLALALASLDEGCVVRAVTRANPQRVFGADVMNRIGYCRTHGVAPLQQALMRTVSEMLSSLDAPAVRTLYITGNTTMLHLFFGVDPSAMGVYPYTPSFLESRTAPGNRLGLPEIGSVISLPGAAAFVGADLTAGLNYVGLPSEGRFRLLVDLGTNAEIVLFSRETALCTAAAAGPCFEGANISCGMSASPGAVYAFAKDGYRTIGDAPAAGLCGTGLIDVIASLLEDGTVDETGYMACERFEIAPGVTLTQSDVRQYQLAKSAVAAALLALLRRQGVSMEEIEAVYISGGFSAKINIENAVRTGLLPAALKDKCVAVGNSSLLGAVKYACEKNDLSVFLSRMRYVDLAADPVFSELFIENMTLGGVES